MDISISIIIPHYNNSKILVECINSIYQSTFKNLEIIVVDNNSTDSSCEIIRNNFPNVIIQKSSINLGYAGGCNLGSKSAKGRYLLFMNNDTIIDKNCIKNLLFKLESDPKISSVQPKIININNPLYFDYAGASGGFIDYLVFPFSRGRIFNLIEEDKSQYQNSIKIFWASGACFLTRKEVFKKVGGFDSSLFAHMEEIDYHWKCHLINYDVWIEPSSVLYHHGGLTLKMGSPKKTYLNHRNSLILLLSNYSLIRSILFFIIRIPFELISSLKYLLNLRLMHFINHYIAFIWIIFNFRFITRRRKFIKKIRIVSDKDIFNKKIIFKKSIVISYFLFRVKKFKNLKWLRN